MKRNMFQSMAITAICAVTLLIASAAPVAAMTFKCQHAGYTYDLGDTRKVPPPIIGWMHCELVGIIQQDGFVHADWVWHPYP